MSCVQALEQEPPANPELPIILVAAAALIDADGRVLIAQRRSAGDLSKVNQPRACHTCKAQQASPILLFGSRTA